MTDWIRISQAADLLDMSRQGVHKLIKNGWLRWRRGPEPYRLWEVRQQDVLQRKKEQEA